MNDIWRHHERGAAFSFSGGDAMTWELHEAKGPGLIDMWGGCDESVSYQKARQHFINKGYEGRYRLIAKNYARPPFAPLKMYDVYLRPRKKHGI